MNSLRQDLRYAVRALLNRPAFSLLAILTLAIGIGVNTVAFSAFSALMLKPFAFQGSERLGWIMSRSPGNPHGNLSLPDFQDLQQSTRTFERVFAEARMPFAMRAAGPDGTAAPAEEVWGLLVSTDYLATLGVRPLSGRFFTDADLTSSELAAVVSERFWVERLGGGDSVAGRTVTLNGRSFAVVGVVPDGFQGPGGLFEPSVWLPLERRDVLGLRPELAGRATPWLTAFGQLRPGVTRAQAEADLEAVSEQLAAAHPATNKDRRAAFFPMRERHPEIRGIAVVAWIALALVGVVLLIACFNVAGLLLARASERQREIGVRTALGASRARILRQLVTEGTLLAAIGGAASLVLAAWSADLLAAFSLPSPIPQRLHMGLNAPLIAFTLGLVALAGILPALLPALQAVRTDVVRAIRLDSSLGGRPSRARNLFVVAQVAGSTLFLAAALLFVRSFWHSASFDPGFDTEQTLVLELNPNAYNYDAERSRVFFEHLLERVRPMPGVLQASVSDRVPFYVGYPRVADVTVSGEDCRVVKCQSAFEYAVMPGHFASLGIRIAAGRDITSEEYRHDAPVAVISQSMAARLWPGTNAVGQPLRVGKSGRQVQVVGVAADIKHRNMAESQAWFLYRPLRLGDFEGGLTISVRTSGDPRALIAPIQQQVARLDPALPATGAQTMRQRLEMPLWPARTTAGFFLICGTLALVLATVGLFGVTYYAVSQRTREFGVRVALGATPRRVVSLVLREGLSLSIPGVILGTAAALVGSRLLAAGLVGVSPSDPLSYSLAAGLQALVAVAACALPAWRATKADPMLALRQE